MRNDPRFRMAEGVELVGRQGASYEMQVSIPLDDEGFLGRQCPECSLLFRMNAAQYKALPNNLALWCVGHVRGSGVLTATR
ncbi:hypothetical protein [Streptomyces sp. NPDC057623]|uniref:hypothetical protein n=1 Tax=Streptomyces sp. NPDC057623 TaxID=3346187 RepID=UPI00367CA53F